MNPSPDHKRPVCPSCLRPQSACICRWIAPVRNDTEVLILQHPDEVHAAKGSARLLHLSLQRSALAVGEAFEERELMALLLDDQNDCPRRPVLLYPDVAEKPAGTTCAPHSDIKRNAPSAIRLVILDATWRKSRKMLRLNPLLQALPRLSLTDVPASRYRIRKAHRPDQLSTLEATCHALAQLEEDDAKYLPLLEAFDGFVEWQAKWFRRDGE